MKKLVLLLAMATVLTPLRASAEGLMGIVYKDTVEPVIGSGSVAPTKVGTACAKSYFGLVAIGDCSVAAAMRNGKICNLSHADVAVKNILGYKEVKVKAYGQ